MQYVRFICNDNTRGKFHPNICVKVNLRKCQDEINGLGFQAVNVTQGKEEAAHEHIDHGRVHLPVGDTPLLHNTMGTQARLMFVEVPVGKMFMFKTPLCLDCFMPGGNSTAANEFPMISRFMIIYLFQHGFNELN
jgi:hypothetical protein